MSVNRRRMYQSNLHDLFYTLVYGDLSALDMYVGNGGSLRISGPHRKSLLIGCIEENRAAVFYRCLQLGVNVNSRDDSGRSPLHYAAELGFSEFVTELILRGAIVDMSDEEGVTPLMLAVQKGHIPIAEKFLDLGCYVNLRDNDGVSALHYASQRFDFDMVKILLQNGADSTIRTHRAESVLSFALFNKDMKTIKFVLEFNSRLSERVTFSPDLHKALDRNFTDAIELFLSSGVDPLPLLEDCSLWARFLTRTNSRRLRTRFMSEYGYLTSSSSKNKVIRYIFELHQFLPWMGFLKLACQYGLQVTGELSSLKCTAKCLCRKIVSDVQEESGHCKSLKMISRTKIRECLGLGVVKKVLTLPLPGKMKRYLCFHEEFCLEKPLI